MNATHRFTVAAALVALAATTQSFSAEPTEQVSLLAMRPMQALSLDRGNEHIVSYYLSKNGRCKLYVTQAAEHLHRDALRGDDRARQGGALRLYCRQCVRVRLRQ